MKRNQGVHVDAVEPESPAEFMGIEPGDICLKVNGQEVEDFLDVNFHFQDGEENVLLFAKRDGALWEAEVELDEGEELGIAWADIPPRLCRNRCQFCFVDQLPRGVRPTLRIKDEDYRHSFLYGNFITLSNLTDHDVRRIVAQRLSPLYVSVHATDQSVRRALTGSRPADRFDTLFGRLVEGGIRLHTQVVLCPGLNDGDVFLRTVADLAARRPQVLSVGVVPVGLTAHRQGLAELERVDAAKSREVLQVVHRLQESFRKGRTGRFVFAADEFYLLAGEEIPPAKAYEGYPQLENGVGMVRDFLEEFAPLLKRKRPSWAGRRAVFATGSSFAPVLRGCLERFNEVHGAFLEVLEVPNRFLGPSVTVAGLLSGGDFLEAARGRDVGEFLAIPASCLNMDGVFLDDSTPEELQQRLNLPLLSFHPSAQGFDAVLNG